MTNYPATSFEIIRTTASEHCGWMACVIVDHALTVLAPGGDLTPTYELIDRLSTEAADTILFLALNDEDRSMALAKAIAQGAVQEAHERAAKVYGA